MSLTHARSHIEPDAACHCHIVSEFLVRDGDDTVHQCLETGFAPHTDRNEGGVQFIGQLFNAWCEIL